MNTPHKHAALIHAWADGAQIQFRHGVDFGWVGVEAPDWDSGLEFRIKPQIEKRRYRVALFTNDRNSAGVAFTATVDDELDVARMERGPAFHSWLSDWVEYEIEVQP